MITHIDLPIEGHDDVVLVRRRVRALAHDRGLDTFATAAITTAASELARNIVIYAHRGTAAIDEISDGVRFGLRLAFRDQGPGIADLQRVLLGGYSTGKSLGLGLSGSKRLVDEFEVDSAVGRGTTVTVIKWKRF